MVRKVIDLECVLPPDEKGDPRQYNEAASHRLGYGDPELLPPLPGYGFDNYKNIFRKRTDKPVSEEAAKKEPKGMSLEEFVKELDREGAEVSVLGRVDNNLLAEVVAECPGRFYALAAISPFDGMRGVREFEHLIKERKLHGLRVSALYNNLSASDRRYYPLYAKCVELDVPVRIYSTMNYANDRPYDLGHPRHIDQIAMDFPELRIDAALAGWPWVNDMVGILRRHPNVYCDTSSHHPRYFGIPGAGWEMFVQFGNTLLQDKIMVGFSKESFGLTIPEAVAMYEKLPLKDKVVEKWLYGNAKEFLRC
ncbi:MAG TPA: amidohydrolase family protein [Reyranella sp.]|nr:amidohydrolase family protein [Reyranella sp.]